MQNVQEIKQHIHSIEGTAKITSAMQMVATSQMRHAQDRALAGRSLMKLLYQMQIAATEHAGAYVDPLMTARDVKRRAVVLVTTDKGLCGALNANLIQLASKYDPQTTDYLTVGRKALRFVQQQGRTLAGDFFYSDRPRFDEATAIATAARDLFLGGKVDEVHVLATIFKNTLIQNAETIELLPIGRVALAERLAAAAAEAEAAKRNEANPSDAAEVVSEFTFEPDAETVFSRLLGQHLKLLMYQILLDARASEHSSRMVSMKAATENAEDLIKDLNLQYNKLRQEKITSELLDISGGQAS